MKAAFLHLRKGEIIQLRAFWKNWRDRGLLFCGFFDEEDKCYYQEQNFRLKCHRMSKKSCVGFCVELICIRGTGVAVLTLF